MTSQTTTRPRIMVDMSATLIHHGHVRLLHKAAQFGDVVVALTSDEEVKKKKGYTPELTFDERREILMAMRDVKEVVSCPWLITNEFLEKHRCNFLVHGADNSNQIPPEKLKIFPRTEGISSSLLRERVLDSLLEMNLDKNSKSVSDKLAMYLIETVKKEFRLE